MYNITSLMTSHTPSTTDGDAAGVLRLVRRVLLRDNVPSAQKQANIIFGEVMAGDAGFAALSRLLEAETHRLLSRDLPASLLSSDGVPANVLPPALRPGLQAKIEGELRSFLESAPARAAVAAVYDGLCEAVENVGWQYGISEIAEALRVFRDKVRRQARVYERSLAQVRSSVDLEPLYAEACKISLGERVRKDNHIDINDFYTALCDNTAGACSAMTTAFLRDTLLALAAWEGIDNIIEANTELVDRCRDILARTADGAAAPRVFSDPSVRSPFDIFRN